MRCQSKECEAASRSRGRKGCNRRLTKKDRGNRARSEE